MHQFKHNEYDEKNDMGNEIKIFLHKCSFRRF